MTRRERILTALSGGMPDRPPISFDARPLATQRILSHYGVAAKNDLYAAAGIDGFSVWEWNAILPTYILPLPPPDEDGHRTDFWGNCPLRRWGLFACDTVGSLKAHRWPSPDDFDYSHVYHRAIEIKAKDMVVSAGHIGLGYQMHCLLRGNEKALYDVTDPAYMGVYLDRLLGFTYEWLDRLLTAARGEIEVVRADEDIGSMNRLMISPTMWRQYYKPGLRDVFDLVHRHGARIWFHSCGFIRPLLDDLLEIGIDVWNPFPDYVEGNDPAWVRDWRRGRLALDGGVSHLTLVQGTPEDVTQETQRVLDTFAPDGGLLIGPSQCFTEDMPIENIVAFFEAALNG